MGGKIIFNMTVLFSRPNLQECHQSLLVMLFLQCNLPAALVKVIVTSKRPELSVKATILLGEFLHKANVLLPREVNAASHCLPSLLAEVSSSDPVMYVGDTYLIAKHYCFLSSTSYLNLWKWRSAQSACPLRKTLH